LVHGATATSRFGMFKSYMDETGITAGDRYCTIGGYVGLAEAWERIEHDWKFVLDNFEVPYFHALEFYGDDKKKFYVGWKEGERRAFIDALFDCLKDRDVSLFGTAIDVDVFKSLTEDERRYLTGGQHNGMKWIKHGAPTKPYFVPFQLVLINSATSITPGDVLYPVMSRQEQYKIHALELYEIILESDPPLKVPEPTCGGYGLLESEDSCRASGCRSGHLLAWKDIAL
jgi:hypothetical protein